MNEHGREPSSDGICTLGRGATLARAKRASHRCAGLGWGWGWGDTAGPGATRPVLARHGGRVP